MQNETNEPSFQVSFRSYVTGFVWSLILTLGAYFIVKEDLFSDKIRIYTIMALALIQAVIQLYLFLHLGQENKPRWNLFTFIAMVTILVVIVIGTLWIMSNLTYNLMSGH